MRFLLTALAITLMAVAAYAQPAGPIDKGAWMVGGDAFFSTQSGDLYEGGMEESQTTISFMPNVAYFIMPNLAIGAELQFENFSWGDYKTSQFGIGPAISYFFNMDKTRTDLKGAFVPYIRAFAAYGSLKTESPELDDDLNVVIVEETNTLMQFGGQGGAMFFLSNNVAADFAVRFSSDNLSLDEDFLLEGEDDSISGTTLQVGVGIQAFIF